MKQVVITGASRGLGRAMAIDFAADGWTVSGCGTDTAVFQSLTAALAQLLPVGLAAVALNPGIIDTRMLRSCFGEGASSYPTPEEWAKATVPGM